MLEWLNAGSWEGCFSISAKPYKCSYTRTQSLVSFLLKLSDNPITTHKIVIMSAHINEVVTYCISSHSLVHPSLKVMQMNMDQSKSST